MDVLDYIYINGEKPTTSLPSTECKTDVCGYHKTTTGAVIAKDLDSLQAYKLRKAKNAELNTMKKDIDSLKSDMSEIKAMLRQLVKE